MFPFERHTLPPKAGKLRLFETAQLPDGCLLVQQQTQMSYTSARSDRSSYGTGVCSVLQDFVVFHAVGTCTMFPTCRQAHNTTANYLSTLVQSDGHDTILARHFTAQSLPNKQSSARVQLAMLHPAVSCERGDRATVSCVVLGVLLLTCPLCSIPFPASW